MASMKRICLLATMACTAMGAPRYSRTESYADQRVLRCQTASLTPQTLKKIGTTFDLMAHTAEHVDVRVDGANEAVLDALVGRGACETVVADLERLVVEFEQDLNRSHANANAWFDEYHTYEEIVGWYEDIASDFESITKYVPRIATSFEGRSMPALHITGTAPGNKKKMWWQCQIHAREWISGAVCQYLVDHLVNNYRVDPEITALLDTVELIVVPFVNPDGYVFTWSDSRLWRKNREPNPGSSCVGTDLNRNYADHWGEGGGSTNPCSETYEGSRAFSGTEAAQTSQYFSANAPILGAIDWHAYSQLMLRPWGWTQADAPDERLMKECGDRFRDDVAKVFGTRFTSQKSIGLYPTTGTGNDWFYGDDASSKNQGVRAYGYTVELRDTGQYGFQLPASQIIPSGQEMVPATIAWLAFCRDNPLRYDAANVTRVR